jgi:SAM-dependent MidA family methyltransferase
VTFVETSPALRLAQAERVPGAAWVSRIEDIEPAGPLLVVANEFFDALPVHQIVATEERWRELVVSWHDGAFRRVAGPPRTVPIADARPGTIVETSPASIAVVRALASRLADRGGAALIVDYGHSGGTGDTLQAVSKQAYADPWQSPGERDLTAHVDFAALGEAARREGLRVLGPRPQGEWLEAMGIGLRAEALARAAPERAAEIEEGRDRLVSPERMGSLFKIVALVPEGWPEPAGFA